MAFRICMPSAATARPQDTLRATEEAVFSIETGQVIAGAMSRRAESHGHRLDRGASGGADRELAARPERPTVRTRSRTGSMKKLPKMTRAKPLGGHMLEIAFADGAQGAHDFAWIFDRVGPMNAPLQDPAYFARVFLENGALTWPNGFDLSPWNVRQRMDATAPSLTAANE
jgi:hypothetical protein